MTAEIQLKILQCLKIKSVIGHDGSAAGSGQGQRDNVLKVVLALSMNKLENNIAVV